MIGVCWGAGRWALVVVLGVLHDMLCAVSQPKWYLKAWGYSITRHSRPRVQSVQWNRRQRTQQNTNTDSNKQTPQTVQCFVHGLSMHALSADCSQGVTAPAHKASCARCHSRVLIVVACPAYVTRTHTSRRLHQNGHPCAALRWALQLKAAGGQGGCVAGWVTALDDKAEWLMTTRLDFCCTRRVDATKTCCTSTRDKRQLSNCNRCRMQKALSERVDSLPPPAASQPPLSVRTRPSAARVITHCVRV